MKLQIIFISFLMFSCSIIPTIYPINNSIEASWKNPKYVHFKPSKILVLAICSNIIDQTYFEDYFNLEFKAHGITSSSCNKKYNKQFIINLKTEDELKQFDEKLMIDGFDAVFVTSIKGVKKQLDYKAAYYKIYHEWYRFNNYFNSNQDAIIFPNYYKDYKYYNLESSLYTLNNQSDKTIVWAGVIKVIDPLKIHETIKEYSKLIIRELEFHQIISKKTS